MPANQLDDDDRLIGAVIGGRYRIDTWLGAGGTGSVYKATHVKVGRAFAVKVLHQRLLAEPKVVMRFEREAGLAGRLRHPNVIGVVDVGETPDGDRYMVMDFANGVDLATLVANEAPMPAERVIALTREILEGLYHAHEQGLIHRDFKPDNVLIERDDHGIEIPRIVDFGIAILREGAGESDSPRLTTNGLVLGTPHYMAPEQAAADPIDHRIDLFALGITIYEMLCGKLPFDGTGVEIARANLMLDPPPIAERVPHLEVDPLLEAFARQLLAKKRDLRPANAKVARELLDLIASDRTAAAAVLKVSPPTARGPATTAPIAAHGRDARIEAPAFENRLATDPVFDARASRSQRDIDTTLSEPLAWDDEAPKRRWGITVAVAVAVIAVVVVVVLLGDRSSSPTNDAIDERTATTPTTPNDPVAEAPRPAPDRLPDPDPVSDPPTPPTPQVDDVEVLEPAPTPRHAVRRPIAKKPPAATTKPTPPVAPQEDAKVAVKHTTSDPTEASPAPPPTPTAPAIDFRDLYQTVGRQLAAVRATRGADAIAPFETRFRLINFLEATTDPTKRAAAARQLLDIQRGLAGMRDKPGR